MGIISVRLSDEEIEELNKLAEEQNIDRSTLLRQILDNGIKETKLKLAREYYERGDSLERSAEKARLSVWDVIDYFERSQITRRFDEVFWEKRVKELFND